jgi:CBS domain-containing protein
MYDLGIGSLVVGSTSDARGMVSERDLVQRLAIDSNAAQACVAEIMGPVVSVDANDEVAHALALMTDSRARHLLVLQNGAILGLVSIGDLVKAQRDEQRQALSELDHYLHDRPSVV